MIALVRIGLIFGLAVLVGLPAMAEESHYKPWPRQAQTGEMTELLERLRTLTEQAERSRAADPAFIRDLRKLADAYDNPWPVKLLSDNFRDGDFTRNPAWTVIAGSWQVEKRGRSASLHSSIHIPRGESRQRETGDSRASELVGNALDNLFNQQQAEQGGREDRRGDRAAQDKHATIYAPVRISNSFAIRLEIASAERGGRFDFGPSAGQRSESHYRVTYQPEAESGLVLSRVTNQGTQVLASSNGRVALEDGKSHVVEWKRDRAGRMTVALDGQRVIETSDTQIRSRFDGFLMDNGGGSYWIDSVEITGAR